MVSPVRIRVSPLLLYSYLQVKRLALAMRIHVERRFYHNRYHNGHSFKVPREEIIEAHGGLAVHGGGDVGVGVGGLLHGGMPEHLRDELQLLPVLEHECGEGVPEVVESDVWQAGALQKRLVGTAVEVVATHYGAGRGREDEIQVGPQPPVAKPLFVLLEAVFLEGSTATGRCP
jgi:hypothetical protein